MKERKRIFFDKQVEWVLDRLPKKILRLLDEVPLHVEDRPSRRLREELGLENPCSLMGLFSGIPFITMLRHAGAEAPTVITIYRLGIIEASIDDEGHISVSKLREQIRKTILHELGHYHGMGEDELRDIGYG